MMYSRIKTAAVVSLFLLLSVVTAAQNQPLAFEVASVKPTDPKEAAIVMLVSAGGRMTATNYTLDMLICTAFRLQDFQLLNSPKWAGENRYSLVAVPSAGSRSSGVNPSNPKLPPGEEELQMLQRLLSERFHLKTHEETREGPVYELVLTGKARRFTNTKDPDAFPVVEFGITGVQPPNFMRGINASMTLFAARLADLLKRTVIDRTALAGAFDFTFDFARDVNQVSSGPSLSTAVEELGLKLNSSRGPVRYVVVDHAEPPQEN
jgi:uncharacterized protein (TIGR03435 family)